MTAVPAGDRPPRPRNGKGRYIRALENADRDRRAAQLITEGWTYQDAADHLGYPDRSSCWRAVQLVRRDTSRLNGSRLDGSSEELRQQQLAELKRRLWGAYPTPRSPDGSTSATPPAGRSRRCLARRS
jgi:hypothetical protein